MRKSLITLALTAVASVPAFAADPAPEHTLTGNVGLFSDYRFRGTSQTFEKPALQGGFDYSHASGLYLGNWNSNVSEYAGYPGGNLEMDFYGGYKTTLGDFGVDVGAIYYYYPGTKPTTDNKEIYIGGSWKFLSAKYYHSIDDYFSVPGSKNSNYLDLAANFDLGDGWGVGAHIGKLKFKGVADGDYTDYKLGVTKDVGGYIFGLAFHDTNAKDSVYRLTNATTGKSMNIGKSGAVLSVSKSF